MTDDQNTPITANASETLKKKSYDGYGINKAEWDDQVATYLRPACKNEDTLKTLENAAKEKKFNLFNITDATGKHIGSTMLSARTEENGEKTLLIIAIGGELGMGIISIVNDFYSEIATAAGCNKITAYITNPAIGKKTEEIGAKLERYDEEQDVYIYTKERPFA